MRVRNTGNVRYTNLNMYGTTLGDAFQTPGPVNCTIEELQPGEASTACNATFELLPADFDAGQTVLQVVAVAETVYTITAANSTAPVLDLKYAWQTTTTLTSGLSVSGEHLGCP